MHRTEERREEDFDADDEDEDEDEDEDVDSESREVNGIGEAACTIDVGSIVDDEEDEDEDEDDSDDASDDEDDKDDAEVVLSSDVFSSTSARPCSASSRPVSCASVSGERGQRDSRRTVNTNASRSLEHAKQLTSPVRE